jgi:hypothetical protein
MTTCCKNSGIAPLTADEAREVMRRWRMRGGMAYIGHSGRLQLVAVLDTLLDLLAASLVVSGYGIRLAHGIELNAAGLALWQETHP